MIKRIGSQEFMEGNQEVSPSTDWFIRSGTMAMHATTGLSLWLYDDDGNPLA